MNRYQYLIDRINSLKPTILERLKHLRGRHDQRDHAWNRGMGGRSGGYAPGYMNQSEFQALKKNLQAQIEAGEITQEYGESIWTTAQRLMQEDYDRANPRVGDELSRRDSSVETLANRRLNRNTNQRRPLSSQDIGMTAENSTLANRTLPNGLRLAEPRPGAPRPVAKEEMLRGGMLYEALYAAAKEKNPEWDRQMLTTERRPWGMDPNAEWTQEIVDMRNFRNFFTLLTNNDAIKILAPILGIDGVPSEVITAEEFDRRANAGEIKDEDVVFRGSNDQYLKDLQDGPYFGGYGRWGEGYYFGGKTSELPKNHNDYENGLAIATRFGDKAVGEYDDTDNTRGAIMRAAIGPNFKMAINLGVERDSATDEILIDLYGETLSFLNFHFLLLGFDGAQRSNGHIYTIFNRTNLIVQKELFEPIQDRGIYSSSVERDEITKADRISSSDMKFLE
jgi:hypothetical protein